MSTLRAFDLCISDCWPKRAARFLSRNVKTAADNSGLHGAAKVEYFALQLLSGFKTSPGSLTEYLDRKENEEVGAAGSRQAEAWSQLYSIFTPLVEAGAIGVADADMDYCRAWWRAEIVVDYLEGDISNLGLEFAEMLDQRIISFGEGETAYKIGFVRRLEVLGFASKYRISGESILRAPIIERLKDTQHASPPHTDASSLKGTWDSLFPFTDDHKAAIESYWSQKRAWSLSGRSTQ